jgi:hypothetical protein
LDQVVGEAQALKLPENRIRVQNYRRRFDVGSERGARARFF